MDDARPPSISLPRELYDHIVDLLASSTSSPSSTTTQSLRACSAASRTLHARAYHHLFSSLSILFDEGKNNIALLTSLRALLHDSVQFPGVGLVYHLQAFELAVYGKLDERYEIFKEGKVGDILNALHGEGYGVQKFNLLVRKAHRGEFLFGNLDSSSLVGLVGMCRSPNLRHLSLAGIKGLPRVLFRGCAFDHLELIRVGFQADADSEGEPVLTRVKRITMHSNVPILDLAYPHRDPDPDEPLDAIKTRHKSPFASLTDLRINCSYPAHVPNALSVAAHAASSLSSLHIFIIWLPSPTAPRPTRPTYLFHPLTALHTLKITEEVLRPLSERPIVDPLSRFLETCTLPPNLHMLIVESMAQRELSFTTVGRQEEQEDRPHDAEWTQLDGVLCDAPFTRVPKIVMRIEYTVSAPDKQADWEAAWRDFDEDTFRARAREHVADALPRLRSSRLNSSSTDSRKAFEVDIAIIRRPAGSRTTLEWFGKFSVIDSYNFERNY